MACPCPDTAKTILEQAEIEDIKKKKLYGSAHALLAGKMLTCLKHIVQPVHQPILFINLLFLGGGWGGG